jgi:cell shape-determining protein MreD
MNWREAIFILAVAYVGVFLQGTLDVFRAAFGAQASLLPALMVYTSLSQGFLMISVLAVFGGFLVDSLSANPLGISVLPLLLAGAGVFVRREVLLRRSVTAQFILGLAASAVWQLGTLFLLLNVGQTPLLGWNGVWQLAVGIVAGGALTPVCFALFEGLHRAFDYPVAQQTTFRPDREMKRGRF